ncbi:MAG TPA: hypothetical protein VK837_05270 [Longimicrobiales bacterium]|nr:hypothetical protein [Longimicrobiales bacterium]
MKMTSAVASIALLAFATYACETGPLGPTADAAPAFNHGSPHGNPGGGGGGNSTDSKTTFDMTVTGGVVGFAAGIRLDRDNRKKIHMSPPEGSGFAWNLVNTQAAAELERTNPEADDTCWFGPADLADDIKQILVANLTADLDGGGLFVVNKEDSRGSINFVNEFDPWVRIGFNIQEDELGEVRPLIDDNGSGVDWNDASQTRQFRYNPFGDDGGVVRTVHAAGSPETPQGDLKCWVQETILVVLEPASP